jgi:hypothetical protein
MTSTEATFDLRDSVYHVEQQGIYGTVMAVDGDRALIDWNLRGRGDHRPHAPRWAPTSKLRLSGEH